MRVGIVGGLDRSEGTLERLAVMHGHALEHHTGIMRGQATAELERLVKRCDLVVIITDVNSHSAVRLTRKLLRAHPRPALLVRRMGARRFAELLQGGAGPASGEAYIGVG
jgi:hypothetical protein